MTAFPPPNATAATANNPLLVTVIMAAPASEELAVYLALC